MTADNLPAHPSCKDCRYQLRRKGECRYNPPVVGCGWPFVKDSDWCGRFLPFEDDPRTFLRLKPTEEKP